MYKKLEKLMKEKSISAYKLAKETGIHASTISKWKKYGMKLNVSTLVKLADYFGVSVEYFL